MFIAVDKNNRRVEIEDADVKEDYYCPVCNGKLIQKRGANRIHHFAHESGCECDDWVSDMSEWHKEWQNKFPIECREVVIENKGKKHRADILVNDLVIEFQHSQMQREEFDERNTFYNLAGYRIVWLFDLQEYYSSKRIVIDFNNENKFRWKWAPGIFDDYSPKNSKIQVYFQLGPVSEEDFGIEHLVWKTPDMRIFITENEVAYNDYEFISAICEEKSDNVYSNTVDIGLRNNKDNNSYIGLIGKTLYEIINESVGEVLIVRNMKTGRKVKFSTCQYRGLLPPQKIYGYLSTANDEYMFCSDKKEIYYAHQQIWIKEKEYQG